MDTDLGSQPCRHSLMLNLTNCEYALSVYVEIEEIIKVILYAHVSIYFYNYVYF